MKTQIIILALAVGASSSLILAQDGERPAGGPPREGQQGSPGAGGERRGPGGEGQRGTRPGGPDQGGPGGQRPVMPIIEALDLNKDGTIDAEELAKASESLKKLDKNSDGKLSGDEFRPQRFGGPGGRPEGEGQGARGGRPEGQGGPGAAPGGRGQGRPQGGDQSAPGGAARPQRPEVEK